MPSRAIDPGCPEVVLHWNKESAAQVNGMPQRDGTPARCRFRPLSAATLLLLAVAATSPASAIVYVMPTDESMVARSPIIVFGEVLFAQPAAAGDGVATDFVLRVEQVLKGEAPGGAILVRQPGGVGPNGLVRLVMGLPMLAAGDRVLLFLEPADGVYRPLELSLGMFFEVQAGNRVLLLREPSLQTAMPPPGQTVGTDLARYHLPRDADGFRRWIADRAAGVDRPADYFEAEFPAGPAAVASAFRLLRLGDNCEHPGLPIRWKNFDRGGSLEFFAHRDGQKGAPGGGLSYVQSALEVWNNDPDSRVNVALSTTSLVAKGREQDGVNSITFEDPFEEIPGSFAPEGGILAATFTLSYCSGFTPHAIPGNESEQAGELVEANVVTQDGFHRFLAESPGTSLEEIIGHEMGHALGLAHPCGDGRSGPCDDEVENQALMRAYAHRDGRGAALNSDDRAGIRFLYPGRSVAPGPHTDCVPTTTPLVLDGHQVSLCYETPRGDLGEGQSGIWESETAGLLWFFDRDNAEVLLKVLDGCALNGHRWVFMAAATDLAFNLQIEDGQGRRWTYRNRQGVKAGAARDTGAFSCSGVVAAAQQASSEATRYQYDDGTFERFSSLGGGPTVMQEYAQRFRLAEDSRLRYVEACFRREAHDPASVVRFDIGVYRNARSPEGNLPGASLAQYSNLHRTLQEADSDRCVRVNVAPLQVLDDVWVSVAWRTTLGQNTKTLGVDLDGPGGTELRWRVHYADSPLPWGSPGDGKAFGIRIGVDADPDPPPYYTDCVPTTTPLVLGGYEVSMCYETPGHVVGQARSGVWETDVSGLLWFFNRDNVEVLVKVLNGCAVNGHHWVYVSPVTDLAFNLSVTGPAGAGHWRHRNRQGEVGRTSADTFAFACEEGAGSSGPAH